MPSWSHNLSQEHKWTGRKLIGDGDSSGDEQQSSDADSMELTPTLETNGRQVKGDRRESSSDDNEKPTLSNVDREAFPTSFQHQNSFQHPLQSSQESFGDPRSLKRTLLTTEEMAESDDDVYDEAWEEGDVSEDEQMDQSWSSGKGSPGPDHQQEIRQNDDGYDDTMDLRGQKEVNNNSRSSRAGSGTILDTQSDHDKMETPNSAIDSGRVNSVEPTLAESSSSQVLAGKRRKKAIKYLEHIILDLLSQLVAITKLQLRQVRSEIGEGDESESESENEELVENAVQKSATLDGTNVTGDEDGKGVPNICIPLLNRATGNLKYLKYPGKAGQQSDTSALSLARLLKVCELLHHALVEDIIVTKRDIYYKDVNLFGKQSVVDALIDDIVASIGLKRVDFNVVASPKGLVASSGLILLMKNDEKKTVTATPTIIPSNGEIIKIQSVAPPRWALVIEKEATFTTLCKSGILADEELENGLLITGKGYPDLATLHFLKLLRESFPDCLIGILVDADPHGLDILSVYRYGSKKMRYTAEAEGLALGAKAEWLGVKATEWAQWAVFPFQSYRMLKSGIADHPAAWARKRLNIDLDKLIPVSEKDIQFAQSMLQEDDLPLDWKRELVHMLHMRRKAEIQILGGIPPTNRFDGKGFAETQAKQSLKPPQESLTTASTSPPHEGFHQELNRKDAASPDDRAESVEISKDVQSSDCRDRLYDYVKAKLFKMLYKPAKTDEEMDI